MSWRRWSKTRRVEDVVDSEGDDGADSEEDGLRKEGRRGAGPGPTPPLQIARRAPYVSRLPWAIRSGIFAQRLVCQDPCLHLFSFCPVRLMSLPLLDPPSFRTSTRPQRSAKLPAEAYVLSIASLPSSYAAAASSPSNQIHLFDKERLKDVQTLPGHASSITTLRSVPNVANAVTHALLSSGKDGTVRVWDERAGTAALRCEPPSLSLD